MIDENTFVGVIEDQRSDLEKLQDHYHHELYSAVPMVWVEKDKSLWKSYSVRDQNGSGSCVSQGSAKALETFLKVIESAHPIYARRATSGEGMWLQDAGDILKRQLNGGTTTEVLDRSQLMNEVQMSSPVTVSTPIHISGYNFVQIDIDQIAQAFDMFGAMPITFNLSYSEWTDIPVYNPNATINGGHCVCVVDRFIYNGEKALLIEDSWGHATSIGNGGQRIITESFLKKRCTGVMYFTYSTQMYQFNNILTYGMMGNSDVAALQDILRSDGFFPQGTQSTGNFLSVTAKAVVAYQVANGILDFKNTTDLTKVQVGPKTLALLNK